MVSYNPGMNQTVTLVKIGGSIITDKTIPNSVRQDVLERLVGELKRARQEIGDLMVLGHGSGSFGHVPASQYKTAEGFINDQSVLGMAITQDSAAQLNRIVVKECLRQGIPAVSLYTSNSVVLKNRVVEDYFDAVFREYLKKGLLPVTTGDVLVDQERGCGIWSADKILPFFAEKFQENGWQVRQLLHVTNTPGVYKDVEKPEDGTFEVITPQNWPEVQKAMGETKGFDVTGGMKAKLEESLALAQKGVDSIILSGDQPENLYNCLTGQPFAGTKITQH